MKLQEYANELKALGVIVVLIIGATSYFAKAEDLRVTQQWIQQEMAVSKIQHLKREIWDIERKYLVAGGKILTHDKWHEADLKRWKELMIDLELENKKLEKK